MKFLLAFGIVIFIGSIVLVLANIKNLTVERKGEIVKMQILAMPRNCNGSRVIYFVTYSYESKEYEKATRGDYCKKHVVGEFVEMKYLDGSETILYPSESVVVNLVSFCGLGLLGLVISGIQWKKLRGRKTRQ